MIKSYSLYLDNPDWSNARRLIHDLGTGQYDLSESGVLLDLYLAHPEYQLNWIFLRSNTHAVYQFGPYPGMVKAIERILEQSAHHVYCGINPYLDVNNQDIKLVRYLHPDHISRLIGLMRCGGHRPFSISPGCLLYLARCDEFIERYIKYFPGRAIITTGEPSLFDITALRKNGIYVNNKMVNWKTGVNFFTCRYGVRHHLPIFAHRDGRYYNLLNLFNKDGYPVDDFFEIVGPQYWCKCGRLAIPFRFIPHIANCPLLDGQPYYRPDLATKFVGHYYNYQIIQVGNTNHIYYIPLSDVFDDPELPNQVLHKGYACVIGRKRPSFWRCDSIAIGETGPDAYFSTTILTSFDLSGVLFPPMHL